MIFQRSKWVWVNPAVVWLLVLFYIPSLLVLLYSFLVRDVYGGVFLDLTFENYLKIIKENYTPIFLQTILYVSLATLACLLVGYAVAYCISKLGRRMKPVLLLLAVLPVTVDLLIKTFAWLNLIGTEGILNHFLLSAKIIAQPLEFTLSPVTLFLGMFSSFLPFMIVPCYVSLENLDYRLVASSRDLGASGWQTFWRIIVPLTRNGVLAGVLLVFIPGMGNFIIPELLSGGKQFLLGNLIKIQFLELRNWPMGAALTMLLVLLMAACVPLVLRLLRRPWMQTQSGTA